MPYKSRPPIKTLSEMDKVWLACAIDTEGCISFRPRKNHPKAAAIGISITNTNLEFLKRVQEITQVGKIYQNPNKNRIQLCFRWDIRGINNVAELLEQLLPYLIIKRESAERVIQFSKLRNRLGNKRFNAPYNAFEKYLMERR